MLTPAKLFLLGKSVDKEHKMLNKYTYFANEYNAPHYRIIDIGTLVHEGVKIKEDLPEYVHKFIGIQGELLMIANIVEKHIPMLQLRSIRGDKTFSVFGSQTKCFYGLGMIPNTFKYGDWLIVCEGIMDTDVGRCLGVPAIGMMTSNLTSMQLEILKLLTNKVILCYDNDKAGRIGYKKDSKRLREQGFTVKCLIQYEDLKDMGDLMQLKYEGNEFDFKVAFQYYHNMINQLIR